MLAGLKEVIAEGKKRNIAIGSFNTPNLEFGASSEFSVGSPGLLLNTNSGVGTVNVCEVFPVP